MAVIYQWALRRYRSTDETGKKVLANANAGIGYHIINKERAKNDDIIVAFKYVNDGPVPAHLELASESQSKSLDRMDAVRMGKH